MSWDHIKSARKKHTCKCCDEEIPRETSYWRLTYFFRGNPKSDPYCNFCGPELMQGKSFDEVKKAKQETQIHPFYDGVI